MAKKMVTTKKRWAVMITTALSLLLLTLTGCGDDTDTTSPTDSAVPKADSEPPKTDGQLIPWCAKPAIQPCRKRTEDPDGGPVCKAGSVDCGKLWSGCKIDSSCEVTCKDDHFPCATEKVKGSYVCNGGEITCKPK